MLFHKAKKLSLVLLFIVFSIFQLTVSSCNETPIDIGFPIDSLVLTPISSETSRIIIGDTNHIERLSITNFNSGAHFVGRFGDYKSFSFLRFQPRDSASFGIKASQILSAKLILYPDFYTLGDTASANLDFEIKEILEPFTNRTSWDSIAPTSNLNSHFWDGPNMGQWAGKIQVKDSILPIEMDIDKNLMEKWFDFAKNFDSTSSYYYSSWAIGLIPKEASNIVQRFRAQTASSQESPNPHISVVFLNDNGDTIRTRLDAFIRTYYADAPEPEEGFLTVNAGVAMRSVLKFDVSEIPTLASIVRTRLELNYDESRSMWGNFGYQSRAYASYTFAKDAPIVESNFQAMEDSTIAPGYFVFNHISSAIEVWLRRSQGIGELTLVYERGGNRGTESYFMDRQVFHGINSPDPSKRPKLIVFYSRRPNL